ncbi:MAG: acyl carrier protein [Clostridiales bacterium]|nr:acyl carrier protein [Clostridiales bacterium]
MDEITEKIIIIVGENTEEKSIDIDASLFNMGIDSMNLLHIVNEIENCFSIRIPDEELLLSNFETIEQIGNLVKRIKDDENGKSNE